MLSCLIVHTCVSRYIVWAGILTVRLFISESRENCDFLELHLHVLSHDDGIVLWYKVPFVLIVSRRLTRHDDVGSVVFSRLVSFGLTARSIRVTRILSVEGDTGGSRIIQRLASEACEFSEQRS